MESSIKNNVVLTSLEQMVADTCFCKLRESCKDKNSPDCMRHRNIYAEHMTAKHQKKVG